MTCVCKQADTTIFYVVVGAICWRGKKQNVIAQSTVEGEYIGV